MANMELLEDKMKREHISISKMSELLNINESTWYRRRKKPKSFSIGQAEIMCRVLNLSSEEASAIFFYKLTRIYARKRKEKQNGF